MENQIFEFRRSLSAKLEPMRYEHSLSVSFTCIALAMRYGYDLDKAELAGLLHDCAKRYDDMTIIKKCEKHGIALTEGERNVPSVLHAKYGAWMAENKYQIQDQEVIGAIRWHTTGRPQMTLLEQIVFVADYIEPRRYKAADLTAIRKLAFIDLEAAVCQILTSTLAYLRQKGVSIDTMTAQACEYYEKNRVAKKGGQEINGS